MRRKHDIGNTRSAPPTPCMVLLARHKKDSLYVRQRKYLQQRPTWTWGNFVHHAVQNFLYKNSMMLERVALTHRLILHVLFSDNINGLGKTNVLSLYHGQTELCFYCSLAYVHVRVCNFYCSHCHRQQLCVIRVLLLFRTWSLLLKPWTTFQFDDPFSCSLPRNCTSIYMSPYQLSLFFWWNC